MIGYQLDYLLNPKSKNYLPEASKVISPKNSYKKETQRSIIYEQE